MTKKLTALLLLAAMLFSACLAEEAAAEETRTYEITEMGFTDTGFTVTIPAAYTCITRRTDPADPVFGELNLDPQETYMDMGARSVFLRGFNAELSEEISIIVTHSSVEDLNRANDKKVKKIIQALEKTIVPNGADDVSSDMFKGAEDEGIRTCFRLDADGATQYGVQYLMAKNNLFIICRLCSFSGPITEAQEAVLLGMFDTVMFSPAE